MRGRLRITVICSYPPPYAGMSIYAERFSAFLINKGFNCKVIDIGPDKASRKAGHVVAPRGGRILKYFSAMCLNLNDRAELVQRFTVFCQYALAVAATDIRGIKAGWLRRSQVHHAAGDIEATAEGDAPVRFSGAQA